MNAIMNKNSADVKDCTIYVALFPCNECAKLIIQAGIKEVNTKSLVSAHISYFQRDYCAVSFRGNSGLRTYDPTYHILLDTSCIHSKSIRVCP